VVAEEENERGENWGDAHIAEEEFSAVVAVSPSVSRFSEFVVRESSPIHVRMPVLSTTDMRELVLELLEHSRIL